MTAADDRAALDAVDPPGDDKWRSRCDFCGWPLGDRKQGCAAPDDCSQRPRPHNTITPWKQAVRRLEAENAKLRVAALSVPDAAADIMRCELFDVRAVCGDAMNWARKFDETTDRKAHPGEALRSAQALAEEYEKAQEEMRSMRETIRSRPDAAAVRREAIEECARAVEYGYAANGGERSLLRVMAETVRALVAQPAARGEQHEKPEVVSADAASSQDSQSAARPPAPLDDAAVLERAAEILQRVSPTLGVSAITLRQHAEHIRRQPPAPAPEPDVFEAFAKMNDDDPPEDSDEDARRTREWFGPLVEALESISVERAGQNDSAIAKADAALAQLRALAEENERLRKSIAVLAEAEQRRALLAPASKPEAGGGGGA